MTGPYAKTIRGDRPAGPTSLAHGLTWLSNRLTARAVEAYRPYGISLIGARIIEVLDKNPRLRAASLSAQIDVDPAATCRALKTLKERGWVYEGERRRLALTERGLHLRDEVATLSDEIYRGLTLGLSAAECEQLLTYLQRLRENLPALAMLASADPTHSEETR